MKVMRNLIVVVMGEDMKKTKERKRVMVCRRKKAKQRPLGQKCHIFTTRTIKRIRLLKAQI